MQMVLNDEVIDFYGHGHSIIEGYSYHWRLCGIDNRAPRIKVVYGNNDVE